MHAIETPTIDALEKNTNRLTYHGKVMVACAAAIILILTMFFIDLFTTPSLAGNVGDISGVCQVEYVDNAVLPAESEDVAHDEPSVKSTYAITMPDGAVLKGYGTDDAYVPADGEYSFEGTLRSDGAYNIIVGSVYLPQSAADIHPVSQGDWNEGEPSLTQQVAGFTWNPDSVRQLVEAGLIEINDEDLADTSDDANVPDDESNQNAVLDGDANNTEPVQEPEGAENNEMTAAEKTKLSVPVLIDRSVAFSASAVDGQNGGHEGCASAESMIKMTLRYENLCANTPYKLHVKLVDLADMTPVKNLQGENSVIEHSFNTAGSQSADDADARSAVESYLEDVHSFIDAVRALPAEQLDVLPVEVPDYNTIENTTMRAMEEGPRVIEEAADVFGALYACEERLPDIPIELYPLQNLVFETNKIYENTIASTLASGEEVFDIKLMGETVAGKSVILIVDVLDDTDNIIATIADTQTGQQEISYPGIETEALVFGSHDAAAEKGTVIIDAISYSNLVAGQQYHLASTAIDKKTQSPILDAETGEPVEVLTEFVPDSNTGIVNVIFPEFDAASMMGRDMVVQEKLFRCETEENKDDGEKAVVSNDNAASNIKHSSQKGALVAVQENMEDPKATVSFDMEERPLAETGGEIGTLSAMGDTPRPYILGGIVFAALAVIGVLRARQR